MKVKEIGSKILRGILDNKEVIGLSVASIGVAYISWKLGIPIYGNTTSKSRSWRDDLDGVASNNLFNGIFMPRNSVQTKIIALAENAMRCDFDHQRRNVAGDIAQLVRDSTDDEDKRFAVLALRDISNKMDFDNGRRTISELIKNI